ncbi:hypothetical protein D187_000594 [Cystobacter fuscus DSM 2262]|uniref:Lipoprotein n=1 Tax=Cystobacter fuscus (strain ATCC 25194 / DSM 2262 / NBRC 100088 / M29) TaxID=1242864 RepID=S9QV18_CYSF2|nr:hypothetical protein [Cystobacter fuscus]EPX65169.1 hypothetical protein D187_000594 [Cystobacter fuscus DSM 2262]
MKKSLLPAVLAVVSVASSGQVAAAPMSPSANPVAQHFSATVQDAFTLLADTEDPLLIYYVPRRGGVAVQYPLSTSPSPRFQVGAYTPASGFFAGAELTNMSGTLSTLSHLGVLQQLQDEATAQGFYVTPAPAAKARTRFLVSGYEVTQGRIDVACTREFIQVTTSTGVRRVAVPKCYTRQDPTQPYGLDTNVMYRFTSANASSGSVVAQDISFQATTLPGWADALRLLMATGGQWDHLLTAKIDWEIKTSELSRQARFSVNWQTLLERAGAHAATCFDSCVDAEVRAFFEQLVPCAAENTCGIRIEYPQANGTWGPQAPGEASFANVVSAVQRRLQEELFNEVRKYTPPVNGQVSDERTASFTPRANYDKLTLGKNELVYITYNPGAPSVNAATTLNVACLLGGFEQGRVTWNLNDPGCRALLGQP